MLVMVKYLSIILIYTCSLLFHQQLHAQTPTNSIHASYEDIDDNTSNYSVVGTGNGIYASGTTYNLSFSSTAIDSNNLVIKNFTIGANTLYISKKAAIPKFRRNNNVNWSDSIEFIFFETGSFSSPNLDLKPSFVSTMEEALNSTIINRGTDNMFVNSSTIAGNNIERVDYIYSLGIKGIDNVNEGFLLTERNGNDNLRIAAILSLDGSNDPASFGALLAVPSGTSYWGSSSYSISTTTFRDNNSTSISNLQPNEDVSAQTIKGSFISLSDLGIANGTTIYGYALFAYDTPGGTSSANLLD